MRQAGRDKKLDIIILHKKYKKYGFVPSVFIAGYCPCCKNQLNIGPNYKPKFCDECGQALDTTPYDVALKKDQKGGEVHGNV